MCIYRISSMSIACLSHQQHVYHVYRISSMSIMSIASVACLSCLSHQQHVKLYHVYVSHEHLHDCCLRAWRGKVGWGINMGYKHTTSLDKHTTSLEANQTAPPTHLARLASLLHYTTLTETSNLCSSPPGTSDLVSHTDPIQCTRVHAIRRCN